MSQRNFASRPNQLAITAIFTSLVCVATMVFSIYVPLTKGFFNIGETMVFITALLFGPFIGAFAGGVGSMSADILLGYPHYAPATLIIKACEGSIVGILSRKRIKFKSKLQWKAFTFIIGLIAGVLLGGIGSLYYSGTVELSLGIPPPENPTAILFIPPEFWFSLGALVILLISLMGLVFEPEFGWLILTTLIGGSVMVIGYFIYQQFLLGPLFGYYVIAIAEIPVNIGQMTIGLIVALPIVRAIWRSLPSLKG
ncbi:ECF transporter S component [Candidatus Bathyarchaeota archaeon]|nr:MAG: ECF transporter S component [Candidatus Bathyarchaeota archaeon]